MMKLQLSKKASWVWEHLGEIILLLAIIYLILVGFIIPQLSKGSKSTGCKGIASSIPGMVGEGEFFCYKGANCPSESKKATDTKWAFSAGGCPSGYICCVGKKPVGLGEGKGVIEIRKDKKGGEKILQNTEDSPLNVDKDKLTVVIWGTDEIRECDVNLWTPGRAEKKSIKDNQDCTKEFTVILTFDKPGMYQFDVIAYNDKKEQIASTKIYIQHGTTNIPTK
ncbi:MAG: hypothetical protein N3D84_01210 [Candidatus Woesearchaeota archaeon]|nr:hypothetical protein [Candidatus Woesearchaeota archaeon]